MFGPVVSSYTRAQAIADRVLIPIGAVYVRDVPVPLVMTRGLVAALRPGFTIPRDAITAAVVAMREASARLVIPTDAAYFDIPTASGPVAARALCDDDGAGLCITLMLQGED